MKALEEAERQGEEAVLKLKASTLEMELEKRCCFVPPLHRCCRLHRLS